MGCFGMSSGDIGPDMSRYIVLKYKDIGVGCVLRVRYPSCKNYEGEKILVFFLNYSQIRKWPKLDPHFHEGMESPVARFEPTEIGWIMACDLLEREVVFDG